MGDERTFSRRAVLRAGVLGGAAVASRLAVGAPVAHAAASSAPPALPAEEVSIPSTYDLDQGWLFGGEYTAGAQAPGFADGGFAKVTLPHTVVGLSWGDWDPTTWEKRWIYRRHIPGSALPAGRVFVDFASVMTNATVFLGGKHLTTHLGGYLPFSVELTPHLSGGDNVLAVVVDASWLDVPPSGNPKGPPSVDYLQPGGIYRDVSLRVVPHVYLSDVFARPVDVLGSGRALQVQAHINAGRIPSGPVRIDTELLDGAQTVASASTSAKVTSTGYSTVTATLNGLGGVTLWSPDTPKLYQVRTTLSGPGMTPHTVTVRTGIRDAQFRNDGFYLNGTRLEIFGLNRHQLFPYTGMAASQRLQRRDAELLRSELGCNMVRCSHYPQSPHFLDACDELGLMVWQEPPGWQYVGDATFQQIVLRNVHDMVVRDRNRPAVIVWGTRLNETPNEPQLYPQARALANQLDPTRQTTGAMDMHSTSGWAEDVFAYDDYHSSGGNATLLAPLSGVPYLVSEAVGALDGPPLYRWIDTEGTLQIQGQLHAQVHNIAQGNPQYAGLLGWCGIDYASLNGGNRIWRNLKWPGVLDTFRVAKPGAGFYRSQVDPSGGAVIVPAFFWDFGPGSPESGPGGGTMIFTNCDRLEIYAGGHHIATGTPDTKSYPNLAHPPVIVDITVDGAQRPELRIDGWVGGVRKASLLMSADTSRDRLSLTLDDSSIQADGADMTRFTFRAVDTYGNQRPNVTGDVSLSLSGPATLIADSPFPFASYGGVGGGFVRSRPGDTGAVTVTASHPTLGRATAQLTVTPSSVTTLPA